MCPKKDTHTRRARVGLECRGQIRADIGSGIRTGSTIVSRYCAIGDRT